MRYKLTKIHTTCPVLFIMTINKQGLDTSRCSGFYLKGRRYWELELLGF